MPRNSFVFQQDNVTIEDLATDHGVAIYTKRERPRSVVDAAECGVKCQTFARYQKPLARKPGGNAPKHRNASSLLNQSDAPGTSFLVGYNAFFFQGSHVIGGSLGTLVAEALADFSVCWGWFAVFTALFKEAPDRFLWFCELVDHAIQTYSIAVPI